jgi:hypothetical protein
MGYLTWWNFPKKAWLIIIGELAVIISLSASLYATYLSDVYFQAYANSLSPILVPILSVVFGISSASIATYLYLGMKRMQISQDTQGPIRNKTHSRKIAKRPPHPSNSQPKAAEPLQTSPSKLKPIAPQQSHVQTQRPQLRERDDHPSNPENKK